MRRRFAWVCSTVVMGCSSGDFAVAPTAADDTGVAPGDASFDGTADVRTDAPADAPPDAVPDAPADAPAETTEVGSDVVEVVSTAWTNLDEVFKCLPTNWAFSSVPCSDAASSYCRKNGWVAGWGMVGGDASKATMICAHAPVVFFPPTAASTFIGSDTACNPSTYSDWECLLATDKYCVSKGLTDGYGFLGADTTTNLATLACVPGHLVTGDLLQPGSVAATGCNVADRAERRLGKCLRVVHRLCVSKGFVTGIGPYEANAAGDFRVACLSAR